jgi:hypothetical protein
MPGLFYLIASMAAAGESRISRKRFFQERLTDFDTRIAARVPRKKPVAIRPHDLKARKLARRIAVEPDRRSQIFGVDDQWQLDKANFVADEQVVANVTHNKSPARGSTVAYVVDDRDRDIRVQAEYDNLGVTVIDKQADRKFVAWSSLIERDTDDMAPVLANLRRTSSSPSSSALGQSKLSNIRRSCWWVGVA